MPINRRGLLKGGAGLLALSGLGMGTYMAARPSLLRKPATSRAEAVATDDRIPDSADVAVIGGGIVGVMTALHLHEKGLDVVLLEKGVIAGEQSSRAFGWISSIGDKPRRLALAAPGGAIWRGLNERLGVDTSYRQSGLMHECKDDAAIARWEQWAADHPDQGGREARILRGAELAARLPGGVADKWHAAVLQPLDGSVEPSAAAPRIAQALIGRGVRIVQNCAVRGIETAAGSVSGVATEKGTIACNAVVLAGGVGSRLFLQNMGIALPVLRVYSYIFSIPGFQDGPEGAGQGQGTAWRKQVDGGYSIGVQTRYAPILEDNFRFLPKFAQTLRKNWSNFDLQPNREFYEDIFADKSWTHAEVSPFEIDRILDPRPNTALAERALADFKRVFPQAQAVEPAEAWGGVLDITPDSAPVIQKIEQVPGLVVAAGMSGHGLSMGPAAGQLAAELVANDTTTIADPATYLMARF